MIIGSLSLTQYLGRKPLMERNMLAALCAWLIALLNHNNHSKHDGHVPKLMIADERGSAPFFPIVQQGRGLAPAACFSSIPYLIGVGRAATHFACRL
jgi:hypothetical protein